MAENAKVALLGTGIMGAAMARNLLKAGKEVRAWNRSAEKAQGLAEDGATFAELAALTGWRPHTTRAALTRLRRRGFVLVLGSADGAGDRKAYRAVPA